MDKVPNDVLLIIFRYLHRTVTDQLNAQFMGTFIFVELFQYVEHRHTHKIYCWRTLNNFVILTGIISRNFETVGPVPKRYVYSLNKQIDLTTQVFIKWIKSQTMFY